MAESETYTRDERKRVSVLKESGVDFQTAIRIFGGPVVGVPSNRQNESRWKAIGVVDGKEFVTVYVIRNGCKRITTAGRASKNERKEYHKHVARGGDPPEGRGKD